MSEQFAAQVAATPDAVAAELDGQLLTYRMLDRRARKLARRLRAEGVQPETRVAICMERSLDSVVAMLAVLEAGGAYVPLDPRYPRERLVLMLEDASISLVLTQERLLERLPSQPARRIAVDVDSGFEGGDEPAHRAVEPEHLAYSIYTSGSTGKPKGVLLTHRGLANLLVAQKQTFDVGPGCRILQFSPLSFDASLFEIVMALMSGATVRLAQQEDLLPGPGLLALLQRERITHLTIPPSALAALPYGPLPNLRMIACAGEALPESLVRQWQAGREIFNLYGPTESTVWTTGAKCKLPGKPSIGKACRGFAVHVMGPDLVRVAPGADGELAIAGIGLARGYLERPALTAERFVPNPLAQQAGERLYRTGDLVRRKDTGDLDYVGRVDRQTKVRGHRIELGEVESVLGGHAEVGGSFVMAREDVRGHRYLAAYVVPVSEESATLSAAALKRWASSRLPDFMVPSVYVLLEQFPLTSHGKVDAAALPQPSDSGVLLDEPFEAPRTPTELAVAECFSEILDVHPVGVHNSFFELGGHSLLITRLAAELRLRFSVDMPLAQLFDSPTVAELAASLDARGDAVSATPAPRRSSRTGLQPPSFSQERVWFLQTLHADQVAYHATAVLTFTGRLNVRVLERSLTEIVRRHEMLRTSFPQVDGEPFQRIHEPWQVCLTVVDLCGLPAAQREGVVQRHFLDTMRRPFDMASIPLLRWLVLRVAEQEYRLVQVEHHLLHDGWSFNVLVGEVVKLYRAFYRGEPSPLDELELQFADFVDWQRRWMKGQEAQQQLAYWQRNLSGADLLELPYDKPRPPVQTFSGRARRIQLADASANALRSLARSEQATIFMALFSLYTALLKRWTGHDDLSVGSGIANRRFKELEALIGMIINNLVLRVDLSGDPSYREILGRVRRATLGAYAHQDVPFDRIVEAVAPQRDASRNPLFQTVFAFHDSPLEDLELPDARLDIGVALNNGSAKFDLSVVGILPSEQRVGSARDEVTGAIEMLWEYNTALFCDTTIERLSEGYRRFVDSVLEDPDRRISELALLSDAQRHQLLLEWNDTRSLSDRSLNETTSQVSEPLVHASVRAQAQIQPDAIAVSAAGVAWSYGELVRRASWLGHRLRRLGVGPESRVGLLTPGCPEMVLGALAILEAGGAYVPIDPSYPAQRIEYLLGDAGISVLLTSGDPAAQPVPAGVQVLAIDDAAAVESPGIADLESSSAGLSNLAYVIYTSGSTGEPKGTQLTHDGLRHLVAWHRHEYSVSPEDRATQIANPAFDASVWEVWPYLASGARLCFPSAETRRAPAELVEYLAAEAITLSFVPTPVAEAMLGEPWPDRLALRALLTGGDRLRRRPEADAGWRLVNHYGPTEATVVSTWGAVPSGAVSSGETSPPAIGRPLSHVGVRVVDAALRSVGLGVPGELLIGGASLSRGYLARPAMTAACFVPDASSERAGARLYRSGDLVRYLPDGRLDFLARLDHQVKVRGLRIEPGEIEAALRSHAGVEEALVVALESGLVGYVVPGSGTQVSIPAPSMSALQRYLRERLPGYMVPAVLMPLERLPLTSRGKIDRAALPAPEAGATRSSSTESPRDPIEEMICEIWREVLGRDSISIHDSFFELGGHSLIAAQVTTRLSQRLGSALSLRSLFDAPTVAELASRVRADRRETALAPAIEKRSSEGAAELSFAQERLWFLDRLDPDSAVYNVPIRLMIRGDLQVEALRSGLETIVARHEPLRTTFRGTADQPVQVIAAPGRLDLPQIDLSGLPQAARGRVLHQLSRESARRPFDLEQGPLLRLLLLRLTSESHGLVLVFHHIVFDGSSVQVLLRELTALYEAAVHGHSAFLPELDLQYADYAAWQRDWLRGDILETQLAWWREQLSGAPPLLALP
ncbi:MAG: amino acid adenylation domain-containing protein, partial [Acidobacteriota bacterium]